MMKRVLALSLIASVTIMLSTLFGSPIPVYAAEERQGVVEEIVVTASKRGTATLLETPMTIQAISGEDMETRGIKQFIDYARSISGLTFEEQGPGDKKIVLRGLQSTGAATTGVYFDDMVITGANRQDGGGRQPDIRLVDMERIEVLKGPQGTLYGASSMSGTIRMVTNKPDPSIVAGAVNGTFSSTEYASGENYDFDVMLNVPLVEDKLAIRAVGYLFDQAGFIDDLLVGETGALGGDGVNTHEVAGGRVALHWFATDDVTLDAMWIRQETSTDGPAWYQPLYGEFVQRNHTLAPWEESLEGFNLALNWVIGNGTVTATASNIDRDMFYQWPATRVLCLVFGNTQDICYAPENPVQYESHASVDQPQKRGIVSSELRYASLWDSPIQMIGGLFYQEEEAEFNSKVIDVDLFGNRIPFPENTNVNRYVNNKIEQLAAFGELTYNLTDNLAATVGVRAFEFKVAEIGQNLVTRNRPVPDAAVFTTTSDDDVTWKFNLSYNIGGGDNLLYATYAEGFRSGGINEPDFVTGTVLPPFSSDSLQSYEFGAKGLLFDGRLRFDAAAYYMDWSDLQARVNARIEGSDFLILDNVGTAAIKGVELGAAVLPFVNAGLTFGGNLTLLQAELTEDDPSGQAGLDGDRIPNVPEVTFNINADYSFPFADDSEAIARIDYYYVGESFSDFRPGSVNFREQGDYSLVDMRLTFEKEQYRVGVYVNNALDERGAVSIIPNLRKPDELYPVRPRTYGINLGYRF